MRIPACLLYTGSFYFAEVALVHSPGIKRPGLYEYFNIPSFACQDRIEPGQYVWIIFNRFIYWFSLVIFSRKTLKLTKRMNG